jgi:hypothetical protein
MTLDLTPIKARLANATCGPWEAYSAMCCPDMGGVSGPKGSVCAHQVGRYGHPMSIEDAEFVAAARADVEALVAEVERLCSRFSIANAKPMTFTASPGEFEDDDGA